MRKIAPLVGIVTACAGGASGVALAATSGYETGTYKSGSESGFKAAGINIWIASGSFSVKRVLMPETCTATGQAPIHDFAGFQQSSTAKLTGKISKTGRLSGRYKSSAGTVTITGTITGRKLSVTATESSTYTPSNSTAHYSCHASGVFKPKRQ
jgi:hypothetical protein